MRRLALLAVVLSAAAAVPAADEPAPGSAAALLAVSTLPPTGATAALIKNGNVRFGPTTQARVVVMLKTGDAVELIERAPAKGWWAIRFPRSGRAWVDQKNLVAESAGLWRVTREGTRARDDATLGGGIVRELAQGELVEDRGAPVGTWRPVYVPNAVAYIHESVIQLGAGAEQRLGEVIASGEVADGEWQEAARLYVDLYREVQSDVSAAARIDWAPLQARLDRVIAGHRSPDVRLRAQRIKVGVGELIAATRTLPPGTQLPATPVQPAGSGQTGSTAGQGGSTGHSGSTTAQAGGTGSTPAPRLPEVAPVKPKLRFPGQGLLEAKDYPALNAQHHLVDADGRVVAVLRLKAGSSVQFSEYVWREVGAKGVAGTVGEGLPAGAALIEVEELVLLSQR